MGRKRTAEDRRKHAEENGYDDDEDAVDDNLVPRDVLDYTKGRYDVQMELWFEYKTTHPNANPHVLKTLKHFAEFMAKSIKGVLDPNGKPTVQTVRNYFRCFVSGWNIDNPKSLISRDLTDSITNYIKGPLKKKLGLSTATRKKTYLTLENYMYMERQLWQNDGHEYVHEGYRVFISAKLKCHVFTSARLGEISEGSTRRGTSSGLRYKDTEMIVAWKDGEPELRYSLKREFAKGMHDKENQRPTHILYELLRDQPLIVNPVLFMLAVFLAAGAFKKYRTVEQVLAVEPPTDQSYWVLEWADRVLDLPVFPEISADGPTQKIQTGPAFSTQVKGLSQRAGMESPVTIHGIRRESLIQATSNGYSKDELMKFAAHTNQITLTRDYLSSITIVNSVRTEDFRSITVKRNLKLFLLLPAKTQDELRQREDYVTITKKLKDLSLEINLLRQRRMLKNKELNRIRRTQERIHPSEREGTFHIDQHRSLFDRLRHMMPERDRLSNTLFYVAPLRSEAGISALKDLITLLKNPCRGKCSIPNCSIGLKW
ncbi:hypothetical protein QBC46DRAFT_364849 [Diplogelasinospora grovesii]|uniref:Uncharacterized protein n=1 Tax=Diplogelasinospora grovesii TaxID=303347 RepID=A0AAN6N5T9_9PEZI|nr:hypothetical protein QBC46DRAFT_364849 [Diplogelasinospora grovesii]